jgi:hypothetical protein
MNSENEPVVIIDCKDEGWDNVLYDSLWNPRPIELRNLHITYEPYMKELANMSARQFIMHSSENRGEFTQRTRT